MSANADERLETALRDLTAALNATGAPWMVIGGIAVIARGVRRFTGGIDAAIRGDRIELPELIARDASSVWPGLTILRRAATTE